MQEIETYSLIQSIFNAIHFQLIFPVYHLGTFGAPIHYSVAILGLCLLFCLRHCSPHYYVLSMWSYQVVTVGTFLPEGT